MRYFFIFSLFIASTCFGAPSARDSVQSATDILLEKLVEVRGLYEEDPNAFFVEIDAALSPLIDFEGFARGVMAKFYRGASESQRTAFGKRFRVLLIRTYASALIEFDNQKVVVRDSDKRNADPSRATVILDIYGKGDTIYRVEYSLVLKGESWKLRNVVVNGFNMGLVFKTQFRTDMQKYKNDIDRVIEHWQVTEL
jgi:phospholipid transport system substrate-binding protein|tara:strand:- start:946 stop:1536 length:591 start_codon:yes stop_codon:yes gene_type:complete